MDNIDLKVDWVDHKTAKYACEHWHYTKKIPVNKLVKIGLWENDIFKGVIIYGMGASATIYKGYGIKQMQICELVRVALKSHLIQVSQLIKISLSFLKKKCPDLRMVVSFADPSQNHNGGIYQATNWIFTGVSADTKEYLYNGKYRHATDIYKRGLTSDRIKKLRFINKKGKYRYLMPLDKKMRKQLLKLSLPYPKKINADVV